MTLWFMTGNPGKVAEATEHFSHYGIEVKQFEFEAIEPQADDLETVALAKLEQAIPHLPDPEDMLLVEDAGLFIGPLNGFPGVYSANALETIGNHGVLRLLEHLQSEDPIMDSRIRDAEFVAVAALYYKGQTIVAEGICPGRISHSEQGENGFGFDPIFIPCDLDESGNALERGSIGAVSTHGKAFGAISLAEKQLYSHRRRALAGILAALDSLE